MADYKEKYARAVKALDEVEQEAATNLHGMYRVLLLILGELKGRHKSIDKAIARLPKKIPAHSAPPIDELTRLKDLIVSYLNQGTEEDAVPNVLNALLSNLKVSDNLHEGVNALQSDLGRASTPKDFLNIAQRIASLVLSNEQEGRSIEPSSDTIGGIKDGLLFQLEKLGKSDAELAKSIDITGWIKSLDKVLNLKDLEFFYKQVFENLGQRISKKDAFIVELSGLIETVVHQLTELSLDLKQEGSSHAEARKDRWRLTELMGGQINTIQDSVLQAESLSTLKSLLTDRLGVLNKTVTDFAETEEGRAKQAEKRMERAIKKLSKVESEVSGLKTSLNQAHEQAFIDALTGVKNRRAYNERIGIEFKRWKRNKEPLALAVMDIDHFKKINDTYGHPIGDKVLRTISQLIDKKVRDSDFFGRVGGEEFAVIFTGSEFNNVIKRLNEFRKSIESCKFGSKGKRIVITMSVGCALFGEGDTPESVYERGDRALYKAKQTGRNKCLSERDL
ncbi:MAG: diguanylate cyclase [Cycloclasticus sp. symbiont of Bathymodiolus heckerae]|nr:MAG: diguanylate cyclase [Cycloclasticus sp. symbiont of Bathymodiolus heckerae]